MTRQEEVENGEYVPKIRREIGFIFKRSEELFLSIVYHQLYLQMNIFIIRSYNLLQNNCKIFALYEIILFIINYNI